jgi:hypothetical protein
MVVAGDLMPKESRSIILFEPYCWGIEHASFNAAFARTVALAYPEGRVIFCGEDEHVEDVQSILRRNGENNSCLSFLKIRIYRRNAPKWRRVRNEFSLLRRIKRVAADNNCDLLVLCSVTGFGLFSLSISMRLAALSVPVVAVPHSILADLEESRSVMPWTIGRALSMNYKHKIKFIALSESVYDNVMKTLPGQESRWVVLDLPYFFDADIGKKSATIDKPAKVGFGFFGTASSGKGFDLFCHLAGMLAPKHPDCQFTLIGFHFGWNSMICCNHVEGVSGTPLSLDEFQKRASNATYSVWLANPERYRLTASATFLDSLAYLKPGIYLRNAYVEHYFDRMGDIGYLCDSYEDVVETVNSILRCFPKERYQQQIGNILRGRYIFSPEFLAPRFKKICDGLGI